MATSNRERIGRMFEILAEALDPFIAEVLEPQIGDSDWALVVKLADEDKGITGKAYSREDPAVQLRMLTEGLTGRVKPGWYPFKGTVTREHEAYASLLRETRNQWAHNASFDDDAGSWGLALAGVYEVEGDRRRATAYGDSARVAFEQQLYAAPDNRQLHALYGVALAYVGRKDAAIREGQRGLTPDSLSQTGNYNRHQLARIYILTGEQERALDELESLLGSLDGEGAKRASDQLVQPIDEPS